MDSIDNSSDSEPEEQIESDEKIISENKCIWCNIESSEEQSLYESEILQRGKDTPSKFWICSIEHEKRVVGYYRYSEKTYIFYLALVFLAPIILIVLTIFLDSLIFTFAIFFSLGLGLVIVPLLGNQIIYNLGIKRTNILGRILGGMLMLIGITLVIINGFKVFVN
ncbi:MAG: hypothetical protein FK733_03140 [Asgard group archaeon]|nr:hypothetical protein [Asgard group archaeon]